MKYVRHEKYGFALIPDMGDCPAHIDLAELIGPKIISAGFVRFKNGKPECYGYSQSTGLSSLKEDSELLAKQLGVEENAV